MAYLFLFVVVLTFLAVAWLGASWVSKRDRRRLSGHDQPPTVPPPSVTLHAFRVPSDAQLEEMRLVEHLFAGSLSPEQYRHRLAALAARDAHRHPVVVPPDNRN
jgi:hypothetical protein